MSADPHITPYHIAGGEAVVSAIAARFYTLMDEPAYAPLRAMHADDLGPVRSGFARFLCGWMGGPRDWFARGQCMMSLHRAMTISPAVAAQWSDAMARAIADQPDLDPALAQQMAARLSQIAAAMINQPDIENPIL